MYRKDGTPRGALNPKDYPCGEFPSLHQGYSYNGDYPGCYCPGGQCQGGQCPRGQCPCCVTKGAGCRPSGRPSGRASGKTQRPCR
ncbi:uncharacterized protein Dana_GF13272 [Drosophila ananassae]|uniref:Uncharacterized protein n=1 Tax=Drosophila ananassae TaxID=7217 RepID=B3MJ09_DROAN|nr:uncharacterized protein Dana_GF13272 [Drosophila ananassae]